MASAKKLTLRCTGISLMADGRQQVTMSKAAAAETSKTPSGAQVVNQPDAALTLAIDPADSANYAVGKDYTIAITG
jgi:hypothetical protein